MAESPYDRYNRLLGNRKKRPIAPYRPNRPDYSQGRDRRIRRIARGSPTIPTEASSRFQSGIGGQYRSGATPHAQSDIWQNVYDDLMRDYTTSVAEQQAIETANQAVERQEAESRSDDWFGERIFNNVRDFIGSEGFADSPLGRALDIVSRPAYGVFEGLQSLAEQEENTGFSLGDLWESVQTFGAGVGRGITGEDKTGFGDVYEALQNNPTSSLGGVLRDFEEANPELEQRFSQLVGFGGEIFLDPLNMVTPSAPSVIREGAQAGEVATREVLERTMLDAAREATDDFLTTSVAGSHPFYGTNPDLLMQRIQDGVADSFNRSMLETTTGGTRHRRLMNDRSWPETVSNRVEEELREAMTGSFQSTVRDIIANPSAFGEPLINALRAHSDDFDEFWGNLSHELDVSGIVPGGAVDDILVAISSGAVRHSSILDVMGNVINKYEPELANSREIMRARATNPTYRTVGLRVGNKEIPFKLPGRAYDYARTKIDGKFPNGRQPARWFEQAFPGIFSLKTGRARALGMNSIEQFKDELRRIGKDFTPEQARALDDALAEGIRPLDPHMARGYDWIRDQYNNIFNEEVVNGVKGDAAIRQPNYTYIFNRKGSKLDRNDFRQNRKIAWRDPKTVGAGRFNKAEARSLGLKPVENAFENLLARYIKSRRDTVRASFLEDLVENYATLPGKSTYKLTETARRNRNLHPVPNQLLPQSYRKMIQQGERFYIPQEMWDIYQRFSRITSWSTSEWDTMGRSYARVINALKKGLTIPYPGFHIKNMLGDVAMGLLDGINPNSYIRWMKNWALDKMGRSPITRIIPGHLDMTFDEMMQLYHRNADAGFFSTEFGTYESITAGKIPRRMTRRVADTATGIADTREMIPRLVHFAEAFTDEARALWKRGERNLDEIKRKASDAALWRVNYYKFDYSALMPWEKGLKTLAFPFYTYLRKAMPTLLQQAYTNPRYFAAISRLMQYNDGSASDVFNEWHIPQWIKDIGFAEITDEDEPWVVTSDILPLGAMDILGSSSMQELSSNVIGNLNPLLQAPIEMATGRDVFMNRPDGSSGFEYMMENLPMLSDLQSEIGVDIPGLPGSTENSYLNQIFGEGDVSWGSLMQNRFGLGLPIREITEQMQGQQQEANRDEFIDDPLKAFNFSQDAYYIDTTENFTYMVIDRLRNEPVGEFNSPQEAIAYAQQLPNSNYQQPFVSQRRPPTMEDVMTVISEMQNQ